MSKLWLVGSSESLLNYDIARLKTQETLVLQQVFPHINTIFGVVPKYWTWADPNGAIEGLQYLDSLAGEGFEQFKDMTIILPDYVAGSVDTFRKYCGTTPLQRQSYGWQAYEYYLQQLNNRGMNIQVIPATSTKQIALNEDSEPDLLGREWLGEEAHVRFSLDKFVAGSCEFDSESVIGDKYKWGLENKLSSFMFPMAHALGAKQAFVLGFDCIGGRFYEVYGTSKRHSGARHPWNDETQSGNVNQIPLKFIQKWLQWKEHHGMEIYNVVENEYTILNDVLEYVEFNTALNR